MSNSSDDSALQIYLTQNSFKYTDRNVQYSSAISLFTPFNSHNGIFMS